MGDYRVQYDFAAAGLVHTRWTPPFPTRDEAEAVVAALVDLSENVKEVRVEKVQIQGSRPKVVTDWVDINDPRAADGGTDQ